MFAWLKNKFAARPADGIGTALEKPNSSDAPADGRPGEEQRSDNSPPRSFAEQEADVRACMETCLALIHGGSTERAKQCLLEAIAEYPRYAALPHLLGNVHFQNDEYEHALAYYLQALAIDPDHAESHLNSGVALVHLKRFKEALACFGRALALRPGDINILNHNGLALRAMGRFEEALPCFDHALAIKADYADVLINRGNTLQDLQRFEAALDSYDRAILVAPEHADAWYNRGLALLPLSRLADALESFDRAIELKPDHIKAHHNRAFTLHAMMRLDEALVTFTRTLDLCPDNAEVMYNDGLCRLTVGDFAAGWQRCEARWKSEQSKGKSRHFDQPLWLGRESLQDKTILLHFEQGLGDTIQFSRYAKLVAAKGATVLLEVQPALTSLLAELEGVDMIYSYGEPLPPFDFHCPLMSLPLAFDTRLETIPAAIPYLWADPDRSALWRKRLGKTDALRIAVAWSGSPTHKNDHNRSIPLADFSRILTGQAEFICVQKEVRESDQALLDHHENMIFMGDMIEDFADTAALMELMDLVITVDTSVAHLAGALGKPVWILLPYVPDWRWMLDRTDSPWYPTARLFRQAGTGDWNSALAAVAEELVSLTRRPAYNQRQMNLHDLS